MSDAELYLELTSLPDNLKQEVVDFIAFLKNKIKPAEKKQRQLGTMKGKIIIHKNFDDPVPGFEEYQ